MKKYVVIYHSPVADMQEMMANSTPEQRRRA